MIRVVIDTNVFISSILSSTGRTAEIRRLLQEDRFVWCLSGQLFEEYQHTLGYPKIQKILDKSGRSEMGHLVLNELFRTASFNSENLVIKPVIPDDPDDDIVLATAVATNAKIIVTGDHHLLKLKIYEGIVIEKPADFILRLQASQ